MQTPKNIIILSEKSSGSSACQRLLANHVNIRHVTQTRHFEYETLYWTKAASVLGLPQMKMVNSEVPIPAERARRELVTLLQNNLDNFEPPEDDETLIMEGWRQLCRHHAPVFLEKSPHHLCQWSALELIQAAMTDLKDVDVLLVGVIRNPLANIYSQYRRWGSSPALVEAQWQVAYRNLLRLKSLLGDRLVIMRYEDMVSSPRTLQPVLSFCGVDVSGIDSDLLHGQSIHRWRRARYFGFSLSPETVKLAMEYGYQQKELMNGSYPLWPVVRPMVRAFYSSTTRVKNMIRAVAG